MAPEDVKKIALITKTGLYDWTVMPFGLKNATSTFTRTMSEVFKDLGGEFLKVFVDDLNIHTGNGRSICSIWRWFCADSGESISN
jgi:putative transposase